LKFGPENLCPVACLHFEPETLSLSLFFEDRLPRPGRRAYPKQGKLL